MQRQQHNIRKQTESINDFTRHDKGLFGLTIDGVTVRKYPSTITNAMTRTVADEVIEEMNAHGVSVIWAEGGLAETPDGGLDAFLLVMRTSGVVASGGLFSLR